MEDARGATLRTLVAALLVLAWLLFLALQPGLAFDEGEHCHAAYLMYGLGQQPIHDFFQHHQRLLWDVLGLYYAFGGEGPEVLWFGRAVVVASMALAYAAAAMLVRALRPAPNGVPSGLLPITPVALASLALPHMLVIRPEVLSFALFALSAACWVRVSPRAAQRLGLDAAAGIAFAFSVFASPRFALLIGTYLLLPAPAGARQHLVRRLLAAGGAAVAGLLVYHLALGASLRDSLFNLDFSAVVVDTGRGWARDRPLIGLTALATLSLLGVLTPLIAPAARRRWGLLVGYFVLIGVGAQLSSGRYEYQQNYVSCFALFLVVLAFAEAHAEWQRLPDARAVLLGASTCVLILLLRAVSSDVLAEQAFGDRVQARRDLSQPLRPGDRVLLAADVHPISHRDVSYYGLPMVDSVDRLCVTTRAVHERWPLPPCDHARDMLEGEPVLFDARLIGVIPESQRPPVIARLQQRYVQVRGPVYARKDRVGK